MGLTPTYYLADFQSGTLLRTLPLQAVTLSSSLAGGSFSATLDMSSLGVSMAESRAILQQMKWGRCTLVPVLEGLSTGAGNPPTSRALGEWWIDHLQGNYVDPRVTLAGTEFLRYVSHLDVVESFAGDLDPVVTARELLSLAYTYSQSVVVDLQSWVSHTGAKIPVDIQEVTTDYWSAIEDLASSEDGPFEWMIRTGLTLNGWSPTTVTRTLEVGQPTLALTRDDITLEVAAPGQGPASLLDATWDWDESRSATNINGWGAGSGADQIGPFHESRTRQSGEPGKSRTVTDRTALTEAQVRRSIRRKLAQLTPADQSFTATMPVDRYTPSTGEVYQWRSDATWTMPARSGQVKCDGWSWSSKSPDTYGLDLVEVS